MPTALAMSSIWASRTPRSSKSARVAATISASRARRRAAAAERRPSVSGARVLMGGVYDSCNSELHECDGLLGRSARGVGADAGDDDESLVLGSGPGVVAVVHPSVAPLLGGVGGGLGPVMSSAERGEVAWVGLAGWTVAGRRGRCGRGRSAGRGGGSRGRRSAGRDAMTSSRIHSGGSWASTGSPRSGSRTGVTVTREPVSQSRIRALVAGPRSSTRPRGAMSPSGVAVRCT